MIPERRARDLLSADRGRRAAAACGGVLEWARSRLLPHVHRDFLSRAEHLGLPTSADAAREHPRPDEAVEALQVLAMGLAQPVSDETLYGHEIAVGGGSDAASLTAVTARVGGDLDASSLGAGPVRVGSDLACSGNTTAGALVAGSVRVAAAPVDLRGAGDLAATNHVRAASFGISAQTVAHRAMLLAGAGRTAFFEDARGLRVVRAAREPAALGGPDFDTGWQRMLAHQTGDVGVDPPYELTYPTGLELPAAEPGAADGAVDVQLWLAATPVPDPLDPLVVPPGAHGFAKEPGRPWYVLAELVGIGVSGLPVGLDVVVGDAGELVLRVGWTARHDQRFPYATFRAMLWLR